MTALSHGGIPALKEDIASASLVSSPLVPAKKDYKKVFLAKNHEDAGKVNVVLISTGSVASIKVPVMVESLLQVRFYWLSLNINKPDVCRGPKPHTGPKDPSPSGSYRSFLAIL